MIPGERVAGGSRVLARLAAVRATARRWIERARSVRAVETAGRRLATVAHRSWLYRWLTSEPEPAVVVIDLRETYTVGPVLAVLDRAVGVLGPPFRRAVLPVWRGSRTRDGLEWVTAVIGASRTGRLLAGALEPPAIDAGSQSEPENVDGNETERRVR